jgi:hypothetical protein
MADALLVFHFVVAAFIGGALPLVWLGAAMGWHWVRNRALRFTHLGAILFVAAEALAGIACPLTVWEDLLRGGMRPASFIGRWVHRWLYYEAPESLFAGIYVAWAIATLVTFAAVPPRRKAG